MGDLKPEQVSGFLGITFKGPSPRTSQELVKGGGKDDRCVAGFLRMVAFLGSLFHYILRDFVLFHICYLIHVTEAYYLRVSKWIRFTVVLSLFHSVEYPR